MEREVKIYLIKRNFIGQDIEVMGKAAGLYAQDNLPEAAHISDEKEADSAYDLIAVLYNDTPLCDKAYIEEKCEQMQKGNIAKCYIGDGYIADRKASSMSTITSEEEKALKISSLADIARMYAIIKRATAKKWLDNGVLIMDEVTTYIDPRVIIGKGSVIHPMNCLQGTTVIGENATVYPYNTLIDTFISDNTDVRSSLCVQAFVGKNCTLGPFACLRKGAIIGDNCRVGDYVEIKNSTLKDNVKAAHLAYIGDSFVDSGTNVGCGTVFANFDGRRKRGVRVGKNVFIGANANLVAPLTIGDNAFIAAGSTVTRDVPGNSLCIARSYQVNKEEYRSRMFAET